MCLGMPNLPLGMNKRLLRFVVGKMWSGWKANDPLIQKALGDTVMDVYTKEIHIRETTEAPFMPMLIGQGQTIANILYPAAPPNFRFCGACVIDPDVQEKHASSAEE